MSDFIDSVRIRVRGGDGGAGVVAFERRRGKPRGKPTGGSGGSGGDVILEGDATAASLLRYQRQPHWRAGDGSHGEGDLRHGRRGADRVLPVPLGTVVRDGDTVMADLVDPGQRLTVAEGGRGGRGNAAFVTSERRAPAFAEQGEYGGEQWLTLDLKLLADAAVIGYPNAGKSTLISRISAAKPKIADYPFTTLVPNLGVVATDDREFVVADIPGLVEGASAGKGLGHRFLRHTERARALVVLLDPTSVQDVGPRRQYEVLDGELAAYSSELAARPRVVVLTKQDVGDGGEDGWAKEEGLVVHRISAVTGAGLPELIHAVADAVEQAKREAPPRTGYMLHRPLGEPYTVSREGDTWVVTGKEAERAVNLDDLTVPEAADFVARRLSYLGVDDALRAAGARAGDDVRIGDLVFTFDPDLVEEEEQEA